MTKNLVFTNVEDLKIKKESDLIFDYYCIDNIVESFLNNQYQIVKSYGFEKNLMINNFELVKLYSNLIIKDLKKILNEYHEINYSLNQWKILISFWLHRTIALLLNRFHKIDKTFIENSICSVSIYENEIIDLVNFDTKDISLNSDNLYLNNIIFDEIIEFKNFKIKKNYIQKKQFDKHKNYSNNKYLNVLKYKIKNFLNFINKKKIMKNEGLFFETCLSKGEEKKLLKHYHFPKIFINNNLEFKKRVDFTLRKKLKKKFTNSIDEELYQFIIHIIFKLFPSCYLENFKDLLKEYDKLILPKKPKFIFTSNAFDTNELFKLYLALNRSGIKYYVGQHGGAIPIYRYSVIDTYLFNQVDGYFNWGWMSNEKNFQSFLIPKLTKKKYKNKNKIAYMLRPHMRLTETWDKYEESLSMFKKDLEFINESKNFEFYEKLYLKAYPNHSCKINNFENWKKYFDTKRFDQKKINFDEYKDECDLNIFTYESTGFFQLININKPTMIVFRELDLFIKDEYQNFFNELAEVGIVHYKNETLIKHLDKIANNINDWWLSPLVQSKVKKFKKKFATDVNNFKFIINKVNNNA